VVEAGVDAQGNKLLQAGRNLTLNRIITPGFWIAAIVLLLVYVGLAEKACYHISFVEYMKACWWPMMITVTIAMVYLLIAY
jgi:hypothetical protein